MPEYPNPKLRSPPGPPIEVERAECDYAELDVTTNFSFLRGASHPDELVFRATELGYRAIAITDVNSLAGVVRAYDAAKQVKQQGGTPPELLIGARLCLGDGPDVLAWATDRAAYARLCRLLTLGKRRAEKGECALNVQDLLDSNEGLLAAVACYDPARIADHAPRIADLKEAFGSRLSMAAACLYGSDDQSELSEMVRLGRSFGIPLLATNHVHYHVPERRMLQDVLTCVRHGCTIHEAGFKLFANGERYLKSPGQMGRLFSAHPQAIRRGLEIAERCTFGLDELRYEYPDELVPAGCSSIEHLSELTWRGAAGRYPHGVPEKVRHQIEHELRLIGQLKFEAYFLTVYDLVRFARSRGILCQGRGSAANSAVCYCIGVTSVDPNQIDVLFERFVSAARGEPPDIDIDFEHERREEVIQYVYEKYGRERAGMTAEVITYRGRSAVRDVGKAMGLSLDLVDQMARKLDWWHRGTLNEQYIRELGLDPADRTVRTVIALSGELLGFPRHLSQHVGGMVMTRGPLCELVPIENASMPDRTVIEWDKDDIDTIGILKVDVLALGMLTCISKAFRFIAESDGATERRSDGGCKSIGETYGEGENVQRFVCMAEGEGTGEADLCIDEEDAGRRAIRTHEPDAPGGDLDPVEHRRGPCATEPGRLSEVPAYGPRIIGGIDHSTGNRVGTGIDAIRSISLEPDCGGRPDSPGADTESGKDVAKVGTTSLHPSIAPSLRRSPNDTPSSASLRRSVAPSLRRFPKPLELHTIPPEDPQVYEMISHADTIGVFQIESRAQMSMLPRLRPRSFYDLVIEVAIVRPGPIQGNMVHPYLRRRNGEEPVSYPSAALQQVLSKTLGVPLFQEQAMKVAMVGAGFSAEEADRLRRAMAAWRKSGMIDTFHRKIVEGMLANGYTREFAEQCFMQIRGFGEYGFPESHAASFALLVYVSAWIKRYHPAAFCAALLNSQPMGFYAPAQLVRDAREHGVDVRPPDVNASDWDCTLEPKADSTTENTEDTERCPDQLPIPESGSVSIRAPSVAKENWGRNGPAVRLGLRQIKGLRAVHAQTLIQHRRRSGPFRSVAELHARTHLPRHAIQRLAEADAFTSLGLSRRQALWQALALDDRQLPLFDEHALPAPEDSATLPPMPLGQEVMTDYFTAGLSLKRHPIALVRDHLDELKIITSRELRQTPHGRWVRVAGLVLIRQRPGTASGIVFETLEDETGVINLIVRPNIYDKYRLAARHAALLHAEGYVERQGEVLHVMTWRLFDLSHLLNGYEFKSRDFH